ncbi:triacylglycerol lipase [Synechococcus sp. PCC 6312]|uniref:esterase/lipase family protein n=1 Tax=Synechococcus sp. (strain ATCC 27167 / PCC 6312) TaxID=195253 RepID=UPI00029F187D|nr:alpha/beta fold hydrolase [Synechococcus sp. PCC 6312]AFY61518.1 PGAP1-like protein [Synechococcus sp. PCC 6312]
MSLPVVILPGYLAGADDYIPLQNSLLALGILARIVPLRGQDWLVTIGGRPVTPILNQLAATVAQVQADSGSEQVNIIGHSAGGWIARVYLGDQPYCGQAWDGKRYVKTLVSLGTPHTSQERWTKKNLDFVNTTYPGAFYDQVQYVCVAGKAIYGQNTWPLERWFTYQSYQLTCGEGQAWGDGVTPVISAHLTGAENITLEGVLHAPRSRSRDCPNAPWYGSETIIPAWVNALL